MVILLAGASELSLGQAVEEEFLENVDKFEEFLENVDKFEPKVCLTFRIPKGDIFVHLEFRGRQDVLFIYPDR